ncbi:hypothetical protein B0H14DRAFT_2725378 [Mycena olivaceomarginata]|nr:hypothetical protein B0H14DRAFT_2725378 [Mycena olivaceomarginata]
MSGLSSRQSDRPAYTLGVECCEAPTHRWHSHRSFVLFKSWDELNLLHSRRALPAPLVVSPLAFDWAARSTGEKQTTFRSLLLARIHWILSGRGWAPARSRVRRYRMPLPARSRCSCEGTVWTSHRRIADVEWPEALGLTPEMLAMDCVVSLFFSSTTLVSR